MEDFYVFDLPGIDLCQSFCAKPRGFSHGRAASPLWLLRVLSIIPANDPRLPIGERAVTTKPSGSSLVTPAESGTSFTRLSTSFFAPLFGNVWLKVSKKRLTSPLEEE